MVRSLPDLNCFFGCSPEFDNLLRYRIFTATPVGVVPLVSVRCQFIIFILSFKLTATVSCNVCQVKSSYCSSYYCFVTFNIVVIYCHNAVCACLPTSIIVLQYCVPPSREWNLNLSWLRVYIVHSMAVMLVFATVSLCDVFSRSKNVKRLCL